MRVGSSSFRIELAVYLRVECGNSRWHERASDNQHRSAPPPPPPPTPTVRTDTRLVTFKT